MADVQTEGETLEEQDNREKETPEESPTEEKTEESEPSSQGEEKEQETPKEKEGKETPEPKEKPENTETEENIPFHKHPRWQEMQRRLKEKDEALADLTKFKEEAQPKLQELGKEDRPVPQWFSETFGENKEAWNQYQSYEQQLRQDIKNEVKEEQQSQAQKQQDDQKHWQNWVSDKIGELQDEGLQFDRNELLKTVADYKPTDEEGNLDFRKGYEILSRLKEVEGAKKSQETQKKKEVASQTMEESKGEQPEKGYKTSHDIRKEGGFF